VEVEDEEEGRERGEGKCDGGEREKGWGGVGVRRVRVGRGV